MKNLIDIPVRGEMLLDTVHLWVAWNRYRLKKGTGDWYKYRRWPAKPINVVAKRHRKVTGHLLLFTFCSQVEIRTVHSHLLLFTKHNLSKILMIEDQPDP